MIKKLLSVAFGICAFSLHGAAEKQTSIIPVLASRLVDLETRKVTKSVRYSLELTKTDVTDYSLSEVVAQTQKLGKN